MAFFKSFFDNTTQLTGAELASISTEINKGFTAQFFNTATTDTSVTRLSARDMLSISEEISREFAVRRLTPPSTSKIVLLPVDPEHLHAYWHLDNKGSAQSNVKLTLRIYTQPEYYQADTDDDQPTWFDVNIDQSEQHKKITLPEAMNNRFYSAAIGQRQLQHKFVSLAHSERTYIPAGNTQPDQHNDLTDAYDHTLTRNPSGRGKTGL